MPKLQKRNLNAPFQGFPDASTVTGLSQSYLRKGVRDGWIPHVLCGNRVMINVPALLKLLGAIEEANAS